MVRIDRRQDGRPGRLQQWARNLKKLNQIWVMPSDPASFTKPKSTIFTTPVSVTSRLVGLMSRCTMPAP